MKVAFIALPDDTDSPSTPPLALAYAAAVLEQQGEIVRIYDLALSPTSPVADNLRMLHSFRPHVVLVAGENPALSDQVIDNVQTLNTLTYRISGPRRDLLPGQVCIISRACVSAARASSDKRVVMPGVAPDPLDALPLPARHLLSLERYQLTCPNGSLQTTLMIGQYDTLRQRVQLRRPEAIVAEMRSTAREHGVRHFLFSSALLSSDILWLRRLLTHLVESELSLGWEGTVEPDALTPGLLREMQRAGCEALRFSFDAVAMIASAQERANLRAVIGRARDMGIYARADLELEPPFSAMPALVDVAATFGLDDVVFRVCSNHAARQAPVEVPQEVVERAQSRYHAQRSLLQLREQFGPHLGWVVWALGRSINRRTANFEQRS